MGIADELQRYVAKEQERPPKTNASMSVLFSFFFLFFFWLQRTRSSLQKRPRSLINFALNICDSLQGLCYSKVGRFPGKKEQVREIVSNILPIPSPSEEALGRSPRCRVGRAKNEGMNKRVVVFEDQ